VERIDGIDTLPALVPEPVFEAGDRQARVVGGERNERAPAGHLDLQRNGGVGK